MKRFLWILAMAFAGAAIGSAIRQVFDSSGKKGEVTIAASPGPVVAGLVAGLLSPRAKRLVALAVGANVAANEETLMQRIKS